MRRSWILAFVVLPVAVACGGGRAPEAAVPTGGTVPAITPADLKLRSAIFADDSMLGRRSGTVGNVRGNAYIAGELARLGLKPAGDSGGFLQRVPLTSYALDTARTALRAGVSALAAFSDFYPYQPTFAVPVRPINGAQLVYVGAPSDSAAWPTREALQGKLVVFRSSGDGQSIGTPNLGPQGPFGQVAGIAVTHIDPLIGQFGDYLRAPRVEVKAGDQAPPGVTQPRMLFVPTKSVEKLFGKPLDALKPGETGPTVQGDVAYVGKDLPATNVVAVLRGTDPALRGEYVAIGAHNDHDRHRRPRVDHDSLRAFNTVMRPEGANGTPGEPTAEQAAQIKAILDSLRRAAAGRGRTRCSTARTTTGAGTMAMLEIAEAAGARARPSRSARCSSSGTPAEEMGLLGLRLVHRPSHRAARLDRGAAQHRHDRPGRRRTTCANGGPRVPAAASARAGSRPSWATWSSR